MGDAGDRPLVHGGSVLIADNILWSGRRSWSRSQRATATRRP